MQMRDLLRGDPGAFARLRARRRRDGARAASLALVDWAVDYEWRCEFERALQGRRPVHPDA